jgi:hypothetical protein
VSAEVELAGLDLAEVGALAYPEFVLSPATAGVSEASPAATPAAVPAGATIRANA